MGSAQIADALASLRQSARVLDHLAFTPRAALPRAVLASDDHFETHLIRDAAPHELALFEPNDPTNDPVIAPDAFDAQHPSSSGERWVAAKRAGPQRAAAARGAGGQAPSPLKDRRATDPDPDRCLRAAKKLLDVYTMPRAQEHVEALHSQWAGVVDAISTLEETLRRPPSRTAPQPHHDASYFRQLELEDLIKREQLEIFALEQLKAEKEAEVAALAPRPPASRSAPSPKPTRRVPSAVAHSRAAAASARSSSNPPASPPASSSLTHHVESTPESSQQQQQRPPVPVPTTRDELGLSSPARRPIGGGGGGNKRASLGLVGRPRPSVGRRSLGFQSEGQGAAAAAAAAVEGSDEGEVARPRTPSKALSLATETETEKQKRELPRRFPNLVGDKQVDAAVRAVWAGLGDGWGAAGLGAWRGRWEREEREREGERAGAGAGAGAELEGGKNGWEETIAVLRYGIASSLSAASASNGPASPSSHSVTSFSTSTAGGGGGDSGDASSQATPWTPAQIVEAQLCNLLLSTICGSSVSPSAPDASSLPSLTLILRDAILPSSPSSPGSGVDKRTPHLPFSALKAHLGSFARAQGWTEEMGTTAVYSLVGRQVVKIDRRGREGAAVRFERGAAAA